MIITEEKIRITEQMMFNEGLSCFLTMGELGVPYSSTQKEPIKWMRADEITDRDFNKIEDYFINKISKRVYLDLKMNSAHAYRLIMSSPIISFDERLKYCCDYANALVFSSLNK